MAVDPDLRRLTVAEYNRMVEACVFDPDEHLELLDGVVYTMPRQEPRHANVSSRLCALVTRLYGDAVAVGCHSPLVAGPMDLPEPDLSVFPEGALNRGRFPRAHECLWWWRSSRPHHGSIGRRRPSTPPAVVPSTGSWTSRAGCSWSTPGRPPDGYASERSLRPGEAVELPTLGVNVNVREVLGLPPDLGVS